MKRTALYDYHSNNSKLTEFAGYEMPIWYTSTTEEHMAVRNDVGIFDVSHMGRIAVRGPQASQFLERLVPTTVGDSRAKQSFYTLLLNEEAGIADDLIVIKKRETDYVLVVNAANLEKDLRHVDVYRAGYDVDIADFTSSSAMIAVQGPNSKRTLQSLTPAPLDDVGRFENRDSSVGGISATISRTGYTGEDGFEVIFYGLEDTSTLLAVWEELARTARPCGLGARDSLRIEAGLPLYGSDIDDTTNPIEAGLQWVVSKDKESYVGCESLQGLRDVPPSRTRRGLLLEEGIARNGFAVEDEEGGAIGTVTSGTFSPVLKRGIALAYLSYGSSKLNQRVRVSIRGKPAGAQVRKTPFYDEKLYGWKRSNRG